MNGINGNNHRIGHLEGIDKDSMGSDLGSNDGKDVMGDGIGMFNDNDTMHDSIAPPTKREIDHNIKLQEPMFEVESVQLQFDLHHSLKFLRVHNNIMYIILEKLVFKIDLNNPSIVKLFEFNHDIIITNCWLSPNGYHFIVQINHSTYYYLHNSYDKFKILPKFKGLNIKNIIFPLHGESEPHLTDDSLTTGDILLLTNDDTILISNIKSHQDQDNKKDDKYVKRAYNSPNAIINVCFTNNNCSINIITNDEVLQWDCFDNSYNELMKVFKINPKIIPHGNNKKVQNLLTNGNDFIIIYQDYKIYSNIEILQSLTSLFKSSNNENLQINKALETGIITNHHIILLNGHSTGLLIYSKLSNEEPKYIPLNLPSNEKILGIINDSLSSTYWLYSKSNIYELIITNESIKIWYDYYKLGKYDEALKCLEPTIDSPSNYLSKDMIYIKQGYDYLQKGAFGIDYGDNEADLDLVHMQIKGIKILAQLSEPFEKICLMLLNLQNLNPQSKTNLISERLLIEYLLVKFYYSKNIDKNYIKIIVLSSWIIELMLRVIYKLDNEIKLEKTNSVLNLNTNQLNLQQKENILKDFNDQFYSFLNLNHKNFDAKTIYQIMQELNYLSKLIYFAELNQDYEYILNHYIDSQDWENSIKILIKMYSTNFKQFEETFYKKSTVLLVNAPSKTIDIWLKFSDLNYERLLSSLLIYNKQHNRISIFENHSIFFLQKLIYNKNIKNKVINSHYLSLLITYPVTELNYNKDASNHKINEENDPSKYINKQIIRFLNFVKFEKNLYDPGFILRLCLDYNRVQPAIIILINDMKLFEPALKLSLDNNLTDLSIFVLNKFNESIGNEDEELETNGDFNNYNNTNSFNDDIENDKKFSIDKNKLQHKSFNQGKKLWIMFARYLINRVVHGKEIEFLNNTTDINEDEYEIDNLKENIQEDPVKDLTNSIANSISSKEPPPQVSTIKTNKVLKYLLDSSYCQPIGSNLLSLKDLLPIFPESIMVNNFKTEIIESLNQYNNRINQLSMEMKESLNISNNLKHQILKSNEKINQGKIFTIIEPGEPCKICGKLLINKNFITFPNCHHNFHKDCLVKYYLMLKGDYRFKKIFQLYKKDNNGAYKQELDEIMLGGCILCNESNIVSIDNNLVDPMKDRDLISKWEL